MKIFEFLRGKRQEKEAEKTMESKIEEYQKEEEGRPAERQALVEAAGAEKATAEQIYHLRKEIGEEEKSAERKTQVEVMGPEKATPEQAETFAPVPEDAKVPEKKPEQEEEEPEEIEYKKAA